jgi:K+-transporting ATPase c subunit
MKYARRIVVVVALLLALGIGTALLLLNVRRDYFTAPNEKVVAANLLNEKLSGPRYFQQAHSATQQLPSDDGEPRVSVAEARAQVVKIVKERQFDPERAAKLEQLIDRLAEPSVSRMIGEATINLLRLNLALDELQ